jgi:hypothetical protein
MYYFSNKPTRRCLETNTIYDLVLKSWYLNTISLIFPGVKIKLEVLSILHINL